MSQVVPLFRMSWTMMLRSRGMVFMMVFLPVQMLVWMLLDDLDLGLGQQQLDFFDYVVPGMSALLAVHSLSDIVTAMAATYKARGVLRRLAVTPVSAPLVIAMQMVTFVLLGVWAGTVTLTLGALIGAQVELTANLLWVPVLLGLIVLTGLGLSFAVAGFTKTPQTAASIMGAFGLPLFFLTGAMFPTAALLWVLGDLVTYVIPFTSVITAVRGIVTTGAPITDYGGEILIGLAWLALVFTLAVRFYRFTEE